MRRMFHYISSSSPSSSSTSSSGTDNGLPDFLQAQIQRQSARGRRTINRINNRFRRRTNNNNNDDDDEDEANISDQDKDDGDNKNEDSDSDSDTSYDEDSDEEDEYHESDYDDFSRYDIDERDESLERCMLKGLSINPIRDYEFALACGDQYVRVFDVRKGNKLTWKQCMAWVCPPHLAKDSKLYRRNINRNFENLKISINNIHTTFVEYSPDGSQMVVTYHGENVYVFNTKNYDTSYPLSMYLKDNDDGDGDEPIISYVEENKDEDHDNNDDNKRILQQIEIYKKMGNECYHNKEYSKAIENYYKAINLIPVCDDRLPLHVLYCNLAMCLYQRMHFNDMLLGIFYCDKAIKTKQDYAKAYFWKIRFAQKISDHKLAYITVNRAYKLFPDNAGISREYLKIHKQINKKREKEDQNKKKKKKKNKESMKSKKKSYIFCDLYMFRYIDIFILALNVHILSIYRE